MFAEFFLTVPVLWTIDESGLVSKLQTYNVEQMLAASSSFEEHVNQSDWMNKDSFGLCCGSEVSK